jgi:hypothetical protein
MRNDWDAYEKRLTVLNLTMAFTVYGLVGQNARQAAGPLLRECTWATSLLKITGS